MNIGEKDGRDINIDLQKNQHESENKDNFQSLEISNNEVNRILNCYSFLL